MTQFMHIFYPDVSEFQDDENLKGALLICARATEGTHLNDPDYSQYKAQAAAGGSFFFAYHFLESGEPPASQASFAFQAVGPEVPLMLDFEPIGTISVPSVAQAEAFIDAYRALGGTCHVLYFPRWYWEQLGSPSLQGFIDRGMILVSSDYVTPADTGPGWEPYGGMTPLIWQYTSSGPGAVKTDWNVYKTDTASSIPAAVAELVSLIKTGSKMTGPYRHVVAAGTTMSLDDLAKERNTTVAHLVAYSLQYLNAKHAAVLKAYVALDDALTAAGDVHPAMPAGLVYWTANP